MVDTGGTPRSPPRRTIGGCGRGRRLDAHGERAGRRRAGLRGDDGCDAQKESRPDVADACMPQWLWDTIEGRMSKRKQPKAAGTPSKAPGGSAAPVSTPGRAGNSGEGHSIESPLPSPDGSSVALEPNPLVSLAVPRRAAAFFARRGPGVARQHARHLKTPTHFAIL